MSTVLPSDKPSNNLLVTYARLSIHLSLLRIKKPQICVNQMNKTDVQEYWYLQQAQVHQQFEAVTGFDECHYRKARLINLTQSALQEMPHRCVTFQPLLCQKENKVKMVSSKSGRWHDVNQSLAEWCNTKISPPIV